MINCLTSWLFITFHIHYHISFLLLNPNHNQNLLLSTSSSSSSLLYHKQLLLHANPINADGNNYRGDITEDEAFLWFDEALIYVRGGSGSYMISCIQSSMYITFIFLLSTKLYVVSYCTSSLSCLFLHIITILMIHTYVYIW